MNNYKKIAIYATGLIFALSVSACDLNPLNWAGKAKQSVEGKIKEPASTEEKSEYLSSIKKPVMPTAPACSNDPALLLCKTYPSVDALLADPNVQKFGFAISVNGVEVKKGQQPDVKYRQMKDGSVIRG